ncbi:MAG: 30S ribosomal protein S17 [Patescibacteria group bacterium]
MEHERIQRNFEGTVVSTKMNKTIVVRVDRTKVHPKYRKRAITSKRYLVHDEKNECRTGDRVRFCETRPLSKLKRWRLTEKLTPSAKALS